jgi:hypothetical protein
MSHAILLDSALLNEPGSYATGPGAPLQVERVLELSVRDRSLLQQNQTKRHAMTVGRITNPSARLPQLSANSTFHQGCQTLRTAPPAPLKDRPAMVFQESQPAARTLWIAAFEWLPAKESSARRALGLGATVLVVR